MAELPNITDDGTVVLVPKWLIDFRWIKQGLKVIQEALVEWEGVSADNATWENFKELKSQFPHLNLEDKIRLQGKGMLWFRQQQ